MALGTSGVPAPSRPAGLQGAARERVLDAAYDLFARRGIRDVGINELIAKSGVAKATFYRHFASKDDVVLAFLQRREEVWTMGLVAARAAQRASSPEGQLLAIFDVFAEWFKRNDFEGCSFVKILVEVGPEHHWQSMYCLPGQDQGPPDFPRGTGRPGRQRGFLPVPDDPHQGLYLVHPGGRRDVGGTGKTHDRTAHRRPPA